jgi:disulfide bond formation protein DsbB
VDSSGPAANILIVALKAVFGPLAAKSAALPPPLAYDLPIMVTVLLIAVIRPAIPANLVWLLALVIVAPLACYIATLVIVRDRNGPIDSPPQVPWAEIEYPDSQQVVDRTIKCHGSAKGIPKNMHLWLAMMASF